jgi:hypothetical protein
MVRTHPVVELALLGRSLPERTLRVGFVNPGPSISRWAAETIEILQAAPQIEICGLALGTQPTGGSEPGPGGLFAAYEERNRPVGELFKATPPPAGLPEETIWTGTEADCLEWLRGLDLDVAISLADPLPAGSYDGLARHGLWSVAWGDPEEALTTPRFFWEVCRGSPVTNCALLRHSNRADAASVLERFACATFPSLLYMKNSASPPRSIQRSIARCLYDALIHGDAATAGRRDESQVRTDERLPSTFQMGAFLTKKVAASLAGHWRNQWTRGQWFSAVRSEPAVFTSQRTGFSPAGFEELPLRDQGYGCADPFPVRWRDGDYVFAEEIEPNGHGRLAVYSRDGTAPWRNPPALIADTEHHLSYPCVFEHDDAFFLIPESQENGRVELWRAEEFPERWVLDTVFAENVHLVDTTPLQFEGRWYFFTAAADGATELLLFHSTDLRGPWIAHPANPICTDVRASRMAGHFFRRDGRLIRPGQDGSGSYGRAIRLLEVDRLSPDEYAEREVERIDASWHRRSERTHTLNASDTLEAMDGWQRYRR